MMSWTGSREPLQTAASKSIPSQGRERRSKLNDCSSRQSEIDPLFTRIPNRGWRRGSLCAVMQAAGNPLDTGTDWLESESRAVCYLDRDISASSVKCCSRGTYFRVRCRHEQAIRILLMRRGWRRVTGAEPHAVPIPNHKRPKRENSKHMDREREQMMLTTSTTISSIKRIISLFWASLCVLCPRHRV